MQTDRRTFLNQIAALPVLSTIPSVIDAPPAAVEPVTFGMIEAYKTWLDRELHFLCWEMAENHALVAAHYPHLLSEPDIHVRAREIRRMLAYIGDSGSYHSAGELSSLASRRAALVLNAVGCDWREDVDG